MTSVELGAEVVEARLALDRFYGEGYEQLSEGDFACFGPTPAGAPGEIIKEFGVEFESAEEVIENFRGNGLCWFHPSSMKGPECLRKA